jgi:hypothetical protein
MTNTQQRRPDGRNNFLYVTQDLPEAKFLVILCTCIEPEVLSPESDLRPGPSLHTHNKDM